MRYRRKITDIILMRSSCRTYIKKPIETKKQKQVEKFISGLGHGPFGNNAVFYLISTTDDDLDSLKDLGTYGFIKGAVGFVIGSISNTADKNLEDYGYLFEKIILFITDIGLGTCWLGGSFNKSAFAKKINLANDEIIPAVSPFGYIDEKGGIVDKFIKWSAKSKYRKDWDTLFFLEKFNQSLSKKLAGKYKTSLEMLKLAPSASNRQPWRIIKDRKKNIFHFYLQRTKGYYKKKNIFKMADLQRIDMGIAMCHFEMTATEMGLKGKWKSANPGIVDMPELTEYVCTWQG